VDDGGGALQAFKSPASIVTVETLPIAQVIVGAPLGRTLNWQQIRSGALPEQIFELCRSFLPLDDHDRSLSAGSLSTRHFGKQSG
jgi:hypothetical protein